MWPFIIAIAAVITIRILAGMNNPVGSVFRWFWNIGFKICCHIPMCGWMAHFIIAKDEEGKKAKEEYIATGNKADETAINHLEESARRQRAEEEARRQQLAAAERARNEHEQELRAKAGRTDIHLNSDGSMVKVGNGDYMSTYEYERWLNSQ